MSFQPLVPMSGFGGWAFLNRTLDRQQASFDNSPVIQRDSDYFKAKIAEVGSAEELVSDRRLLRVALGAFGLQEDINNRAFVQKVLESDTSDTGSLANRLADKRYLEMAGAFAFGEDPAPLKQKEEGFADRILASWRGRQFEVAVGEQDPDMRLALAARRDLAALAERGSSERTLWFTVLGNPPLRQVFETAFRLPDGFGSLDIDQQLGVLQTRTERLLGDGSISQFRDPDRGEQLVRRFMLMSSLQAASQVGNSSGQAALQLLRGAV